MRLFPALLSGLLALNMTFNANAQESFKLEELLAARLSDAELEQGWIRLFDGQTMLGWKDAGKANWRVQDGALQADAGENGLLCTTVPFSNYELTIEFKAAEKTNSGVFLRTPLKPKDPAKDCFELNIAPTHGIRFECYLMERKPQLGWMGSKPWITPIRQI
jgi:hypothetical protein